MRKLLIWAISLLSNFCVAQDPEPQTGALRITWPLNRTVFQQNTNSQATLNIAGQHVGSDLYPGFLKVRKLQYKIVKLKTQDGSDDGEYTNGYEDFNNSDINNDISSQYLRTFNKTLSNLPKGWYRLQVRIRKGLLSGYRTIQRQDILFGVGDNYLIAGQSNAAGYIDENQPEDGGDPGIIQNSNNYTAHHSISVVDRPVLENTSNSVKIKGFPINIPISTTSSIQKGFSKLEKTKNGTYTPIYPRGIGSWCWGPLGSKLVENQPNTPIIFFNSASPNSEIKSWSDKYYRDDAGNFIYPPLWDTTPCNTLPCPNNTTYWVYKQFRSSLQMYGHILGLRAILWHQGESDAMFNLSDYSYYTTRMNELINQSRTDIGNPNLSWLISEVSYYYNNGEQNKSDGTSRSTLNLAQQSVWDTGNKKYAGVFTDDLGADKRNSVLKIHFTGETLKTVGERWFSKNPSQAIPTEGKLLLNLDVTLNGSTYRLTAPSGYAKYFWVENEDGIYSALNSDLSQNYYDVPLNHSGSPKFITCYAGESTGEPIGDATVGWNLKLRMTQPFIIPGYENAPVSLVVSKNLLAYNSSGGLNSFTLTATNLNWEALENIPWLSFQTDEDLNGGEGNYRIIVTAEPNTSTSARTTNINIQEQGGGFLQNIEVYQEGISDCNTSLNLTSPHNDYQFSTTKKTATTIQATNQLVVNGTKIDYKAGNSIILNAGFKVDNGVVFKAQIEGCVADVPWQTSIIGNISGSITINNGTLTINGTGSVIGTADNIQYYQNTFSGDVTVIARIVNITAIDGMRGGIMFRSSTNQDAKMYELILDGNGNVGKLKRRNTGGNVDFVGYAPMPTSNTWLKMVKTGNTITCFVSEDGTMWNELVGWDNHSDNDLGTNFMVGFVGYNSGNSQNCTVVLDNISVNGVPVY